MTPIHAIHNLLNPASFPILCFNKKKKDDDEDRELISFFTLVFGTL